MAEAKLGVSFQFLIDNDGEFKCSFRKRDVLLLLWRFIKLHTKRLFKDTEKLLHKGVFPLNYLFFALLVVTSGTIYKLNVLSYGSLIHRINYYMPGGFSFIKMIFAHLFVIFCIWLLFGFIIQNIISFMAKRTLYNFNNPSKYKFVNFIDNFISKFYIYIVIFIKNSTNHRLYSFQNCLPYLENPPLEHTVNAWLKSIEPLVSEKDYAVKEKEAKHFLDIEGPKLQYLLNLKYYFSKNYISDWWEKYIYLGSRMPIVINSNYYCLDNFFVDTTNQASRAANLIKSFLKFRNEMDSESLKPYFYQDSIPTCSYQYKRAFNTTRCPGIDFDVLNHYRDSDFVVVLHKGRMFKLKLFHKKQEINACDLEYRINLIINRPLEDINNVHEKHLPALTTLPRYEWAVIYNEYFRSGPNEEAIYCINKSAFFVILEDEEADYSSDDGLCQVGKSCIHGNGYNRWFDKSIQLIVFKNGKIGCNVEHSWADAPIISQIVEFSLHMEKYVLGYNKDGTCRGTRSFYDKWENIPLNFIINPQLKLKINDACEKAIKMNQDLDLRIMNFTEFGKGLIKKFKVSPDAFIQIVLQLSYYKDQGHFDLTYESAMTRCFRRGRTETIRSCTTEKCDFVKSFFNKEISKEEKINLFQKAWKNHSKLASLASIGMGCDRHLFALYVASRALKLKNSFLEHLLTEPWKLSTSQTPVGMTKLIDLNKAHDFVTSGGGFGPVSNDGYGVSYIICGDNDIIFHVSSKFSSPNTNSKRFIDNIKDSMFELADLLK